MPRPTTKHPVENTLPIHVVVVELDDGRSGGIAYSRSYEHAIDDPKWGADVRWTLDRSRKTQVEYHDDESDAKLSVTNQSGTAHIQFTLRRPEDVPTELTHFIPVNNPTVGNG